MIVAKTVDELRSWRAPRETVGFVPTMGALHEGHLSLVRQSLASCEQTVVSIYVNPTQFNDPDDLANYPDTFDDDLAMLQSLAVDCVFAPGYEALYPDDFAYRVEENAFSSRLCGAHRPGHFTGVLTVVMKLLNIVRPGKVFFGEKDFQQLTLIRNMVEAFFMDTEVVGCPTVREQDGLAMSSRNLNLSTDDRKRAPLFYKALHSAESDDDAARQLAEAGFEVDYVETVDRRRLGAVSLGHSTRSVRLIDNVALED